MNQDKFKCIIWGTPLKGIIYHFEQDQEQQPSVCSIDNEMEKYRVCNPRTGGKYIISHKLTKIPILTIKDSTTQEVREINEEEKLKISGYIAKENLRRNIPDLDKLMENNNWLEKLPPIPLPSERAYLLLEALIKRTDTIGKEFCIITYLDQPCFNFLNPRNEFFYPISYSSKEQEIQYLFNYLEQTSYIEKSYNDSSSLKYRVTVKGFEKIKNVSNIGSKTAFIAMWIHEDMNHIYETIAEAIRQAGYKPIRIDKKEHINKIDDEILSEINQSLFIVCDLTSEKGKPRGSVYFEAGYTLGKNIPIIWTCKKELEKDLPFDIRQYNCLPWEKDKLNDFEKKLKHRIESIIGKGPLKGSLE